MIVEQVEAKALLPEGDYEATIVAVEEYEGRGSNKTFIRIYIEVQGYRLAIYQVCGPLLRALIMAQKQQYIGLKVLTKISHEVYDDRIYHNVRAIALP